jgi:hypothetical protein
MRNGVLDIEQRRRTPGRGPGADPGSTSSAQQFAALAGRPMLHVSPLSHAADSRGRRGTQRRDRHLRELWVIRLRSSLWRRSRVLGERPAGKCHELVAGELGCVTGHLGAPGTPPVSSYEEVRRRRA